MLCIAKVLDTKFVKEIESSFFLSSFLLVISDNKCFRAILVLSTSLIVESNRY